MIQPIKNFGQVLSTLPTSELSFFKKMVMASLLFIGLSNTILAQSEKEKPSFTELIYIEADPFAYINKGYSIHLGYENWGMRFDLTKVKVDFPAAFEEAFYDTKAFDLVTNINGIKVDFFGNRQNWTRGAFAGVDINHQTLNFTHRESLQSENLSTFNIGVRAGYKVNLFKGFYVTPWVALWKNVNDIQSFTVGDDIIDTNEWDWIATIHFGYAIKL